MAVANFPMHLESAALGRYLSQAYAVPMLSAEEEFEHATAFRADQSPEAARALVMSHIRFVVHIAKKYQGFGLQLSDLIQEGTVGLMKAVHRFDPAVGARLASFAVHWIKSAIHEYVLKNWRLVKIATTKAQRKLFFNLHRFLGEVSSLSDEDVRFVAGALEVPEKEVRTMELRLRAGHELSVSAEDDSDDSTRGYAAIELVGAQRYEPEQQVLEADFLNHRDGVLSQAMGLLDARAQDIIQQRWLAEKKMTLKALAERYNVSAERIRQLEQLAFKQLSKSLSGVTGCLTDQRNQIDEF